jgi:hypothetical protein
VSLCVTTCPLAAPPRSQRWAPGFGADRACRSAWFPAARSSSGNRGEQAPNILGSLRDAPQDLEHNRVIPSDVKLAVWKRDRGQCVTCGSADNLHFDHVLPFSRGGSSLLTENVQLLCARHNLAKSNRIE